MASSIDDDLKHVLQIVRRAGVFSVGLVPQSHRYYDPDRPLRAHRNVLLPILGIASECWVYGIRRSSAAFRAASDILTASKGKFQVNIEGDPVTGRERFWNVQGGERGSIVIVAPYKQFKAAEVFSACNGAWVCDNFLTGHTPAAARFARERAASGERIALCLSRNNGIEWMDVCVKPSNAVRLFNVARDNVKRA